MNKYHILLFIDRINWIHNKSRLEIHCFDSRLDDILYNRFACCET